jgi:hypothetical protein
MFSVFATNIIAHEFLHLLFALTISNFVFRKFKSLRLIPVVFLVTFFIDIDHLTEGFLIYGPNLNWIRTFQGNYFRESGKMTILLHSWELIPLILYLGKKFKVWPVVFTASLALICHYIVDQLVYSINYGLPILEYSVIFRFWHNFDWLELCGGCK